MTLIAAVKAYGLVMAADTEVTTPNYSKTHTEKLHFLYGPQDEWKIILAGAGAVDYILMARDLVKEKIKNTHGTNQDIVTAIRKSVIEVWRHARYEPQAPDIRLLIGSFSSDNVLKLTVVSGASVRDGSDLEAMGGGDATFTALADKFLPYGKFSSVGTTDDAVRVFMIYAFQQAKQTIPGVGGNTRIVTLSHDGNIKWEKDYSVLAVQGFFSGIDAAVHFGLQRMVEPGKDLPEHLIEGIYHYVKQNINKLREQLEEIKNDNSLL